QAAGRGAVGQEELGPGRQHLVEERVLLEPEADPEAEANRQPCLEAQPVLVHQADAVAEQQDDDHHDEGAGHRPRHGGDDGR
ncbi:Uncharacterized protein APZ42_003172, partial [Daphnia magna]